MHFAARSALLASCLALRAHAMPVASYSVVDVDGGSSTTDATSEQPETVYHTVTKSPEAKEPEPTTVSVSVTVVETTSITPTAAAAESTNASSSTSESSSSSLNALSVLSSAQSTFSAYNTSKSIPSALPATTHAPSNQTSTSAAAAPLEESDSDEGCEVARVTVTADVPDAEETSAPPTEQYTNAPGSTVTLLSTTTVIPAAAPTSYYDDGMWHTSYAIKPSGSPEAEAAPVPVEQQKQQTNQTAPSFAGNSTSQATNGTYHARRQLNAATPTINQPSAGTGAPEMLVHPFMPLGSGASIARRQLATGTAAGFLEPRQLGTGTSAAGVWPRQLATGTAAAPLWPRQLATGTAAAGVWPRQLNGDDAAPVAEGTSAPQATGILARAAPTGDAVADPEVLLASAPTAASIVGRAIPTGYSVVSWNETAAA